VDLGKVGYGWLFSSKTLESVPDVYEEVNLVSPDSILPQFLVNTRVAGAPLFEWLVLFVGMPFLYLLTLMLSRLLSPLAGRLQRCLRKNPDLPNLDVLPAPVRLLLIAFIIRWAISNVTLPLLARQFWSSTATVIIILSCVWLFSRINGRIEKLICRRLMRSHSTGAVAVSRLLLRVIDVLAVFVGVLVGLNHFGLNPTAALAGLGVGGIAVALAGQKTLENVIGGVSVIFDQTVRVGDNLKVGETSGTVEDIGLRSTRIRTLDRTMVSVPNGQIANASLENISARDKFWFHPNLYLRYDTTPAQVRLVLEDLKELLTKQPSIESKSIRVSFISLGTSALEITISAYLFARDWVKFLDIQGELQIRILEIVEEAGTHIAPSVSTAPTGKHAWTPN
jgi:MscS family membrane protein